MRSSVAIETEHSHDEDLRPHRNAPGTGSDCVTDLSREADVRLWLAVLNHL